MSYTSIKVDQDTNVHQYLICRSVGSANGRKMKKWAQNLSFQGTWRIVELKIIYNSSHTSSNMPIAQVLAT